MNAFDNDLRIRHITMAALGNIQKYTDDYELILMDSGEQKEIIDKYQCVKLTKHLKLEKHIGYSASMNLGAKESNPEYPYICFIHNDVFVWEGWLPKLLSLLEQNYTDVVLPSQGHITRQEVLDSYSGVRQRLDNDAGLMVMTKKIFEKSGGWDERFGAIYHDYVYRQKCRDTGIRILDTSSVIITHIGWATLGQNPEQFDKLRESEGQLIGK